MFDITQGRSTGVQVQAVSRSGTNDLHGVDLRLLPQRQVQRGRSGRAARCCRIQNQQVGFTLGGPIVRDRVHFFGSYEYERSPATAFLTPTRAAESDLVEFAIEDGATRTTWRAWTTSISPTNNFSVRGCSAGSSTTRSRSRAAPPTRRWPSTSATTRPTSYGTWTRVDQQQPDDAAARRDNALLLVQRRRFRRTDVQFYNTPFVVPEFQFPDLTLGGQQNYPELHVA